MCFWRPRGGPTSSRWRDRTFDFGTSATAPDRSPIAKVEHNQAVSLGPRRGTRLAIVSVKRGTHYVRSALARRVVLDANPRAQAADDGGHAAHDRARDRRDDRDLRGRLRRADSAATLHGARRSGRCLALEQRRARRVLQSRLLGIDVPHIPSRGSRVRAFRYLEQQRRGRDGIGDPEEVSALSVSSEFLPALGVRPALGRWFSESEHEPGTAETIILTHGYWQTRLGADPNVIGRTITVDGRPREVIGLMPRRFSFTQRLTFVSPAPAFLLPHRFDPNALPPHVSFNYQGIARLRSGVTLDQANADVARMLSIWVDRYGIDRAIMENARIGPDVHALKSDVVGDVGICSGRSWAPSVSCC